MNSSRTQAAREVMIRNVAAHSAPSERRSVNPAYLIDGLSCLDAPYACLTYPQKARLVVLTGIAEPDAEPDEQFRYLFIPVRSGADG